MKKRFLSSSAMVAMMSLLVTIAFISVANAHGNGNANTPAFVNTWHGLGSGHQGNNNPGDTAQDRHNFDQATAGNSNHNPGN